MPPQVNGLSDFIKTLSLVCYGASTMHYYITYLCVGLCLALPGVCRAVQLSEIMPNPTLGKEWVELYNPTSSTFDLAGWKLCDSRTTSCTIAQLTGQLEPEQWLVVWLSSSYLNNDGDTVYLKDASGTIHDHITYGTNLPAPAKGQSLMFDGVDWKITLTPTPEAINELAEPEKAAPESVNTSYSPPLKAAPEQKPIPLPIPKILPPPPIIIWKTLLPPLAIVGETTTLSVADTTDKRGGVLFFSWKIGEHLTEGTTLLHTFVTSGPQTIVVSASSTSNTTSTHQFTIPVVAPTTSPIRISEIAPDEPEYIELYNTGDTAIDIGGWKLVTNKGDSFTFVVQTIVPPHSYRVLYRASTGLDLPNAGTSIYLLNSSTILADSIAYPTLKNEQSYQRIDNTTIWGIPTPGTPPLAPTELLGEKITSTVTLTGANKTAIYTNLSTTQARTIPTKTNVRVSGQVTALPNTYGTQFFYLSDTTGGIQIFRTDKKFPPLTLGQYGSVTGELSLSHSIPRLKATSITLGTTSTLITRTSTIAEAIELAGQLVTIAGEITKRLSSQLYLNDADDELLVTIKSGTNIQTKNYTVGDEAIITGIIEHTGRGPELWPRSPDDIHIQTSTPTPAPQKINPIKKQSWLLPSMLAAAALISLAVLKNKKAPRLR